MLTGQTGLPIDYQLQHPKHEFLAYVTAQHGLMLHGTHQQGLRKLHLPKTLPGGLDDFGNQMAVYGTTDSILAMYYAILDRSKLRGNDNGFYYAEDIDSTQQAFYELAVDAEALPKRPWCEGAVYLVAGDTFVPDPKYGDELVVQYTSREDVQILGELRLSPGDLATLRDSRQFNAHRVANRYVHIDVQRIDHEGMSHVCAG